MRKRKLRGYGGNHHEKLGRKRISCASQFTIPNMAGMTPDPACNYTDTWSSQPNLASRTPDFSYPLVSTTSFLSSSPISLFLVHNSTIIAEPKVKSSLSILQCHDHELIVSTAYAKYRIHRVQCTPSTAYTKYSIHRVQHTPSTASTQDCFSSSYSHDCELNHECSISFWRASLHDRSPSAWTAQRLSHIVTFPRLGVH